MSFQPRPTGEAAIPTKTRKNSVPSAQGQRAVMHMARPDEWAADLGLRVDGRRFSIEGAEYVRQVIRDTSPKLVVKKAAQTRFTITFLVRTFHWIIQRENAPFVPPASENRRCAVRPESD
jgi:hypothetical protein